MERRKAKGEAHPKPAFLQRAFSEPFFNLLGAVLGWAWTCAPFVWRRRMDLWLCRAMGGHPALANPLLANRIQEALRLARAIREKTNQWPAFLFLTSHPPTEGPLAWMRFEMLRQGLHIAFALSAEARTQGFEAQPPQCVLAVDPYALDSVSGPVGAMYAAFIHRVYFAYDRQASTQSWLQRHFFLRQAGYATAGWRLVRRLRKNIPILMALGGGLPVNARLYYAAREFIQRLSIPRIRKRQAEYDWVRLLETHERIDPAIDGLIPASTEARLKQRLEDWGLSPEEAQSQLARFKKEFACQVPWRERLWDVLCRRLVRRGQPLMVMPAQHHDSPPSIQIGEPQALLPQDLPSLNMRGEHFNRFYL